MFRPLLSAIVHSVQPRVPAWRGAIMSILSSQRKVAWEESFMGYRSFVVAKRVMGYATVEQGKISLLNFVSVPDPE
jgi:hypothetical protein